ncbi:MAG: glycoside hydrolase family 140 protein [Chloroflexota bacterium]|nr:glycoside hydrolase family 140 protein [Chloroflexota bacterium]
MEARAAAMLRVSGNGRFLTHENGEPFFFLADTGWTLLQRLDRDETDRYLRDRVSKGFTAIQVMGISEFDGLTVPNRYGNVPLHDLDPTRPSESYFRHVDYVVVRAAELGLWIALLPTWGDKVGPRQWGTEPQVFTPESARVYGRFLGSRYRDAAVIWVLGGDRNPVDEAHFATWRALAGGLRDGDGGTHLMTFHPQGGASSSQFFHEDPWLDFNMLQSGHAAWNTPNYEAIAADYCRAPAKPCLDGEPCYEDHPVNWKPEHGYFGAWDARKAAYWALFAGAHGHTYGANGVFQFWSPGMPDRFGVRRPWTEAISLPGSTQMQHARRLLESRPFLTRIPDQSLLVSDPGAGAEHVQVCRGEDGGYVLAYSASGLPFRLDPSGLPADRYIAHWYDPRTGSATAAGEVWGRATVDFAAPSSGPDQDWVLVLDDVSRGFGVPGEGT